MFFGAQAWQVAPPGPSLVLNRWGSTSSNNEILLTGVRIFDVKLEQTTFHLEMTLQLHTSWNSDFLLRICASANKDARSPTGLKIPITSRS